MNCCAFRGGKNIERCIERSDRLTAVSRHLPSSFERHKKSTTERCKWEAKNAHFSIGKGDGLAGQAQFLTQFGIVDGEAPYEIEK
jgi:hypothetical protein